MRHLLLVSLSLSWACGSGPAEDIDQAASEAPSVAFLLVQALSPFEVEIWEAIQQAEEDGYASRVKMVEMKDPTEFETIRLPLVMGGLGHGSGAHAPNEYMVIRPKEGTAIAALPEIEKAYVDLLFALAEQ